MIEDVYKSLRIIDGKPRWVITDGNGDIVNKNPTKEQIKIATEERYKIYRCCRCGAVETGKTWFGHDHWYSHLCDKKNCTKYFCSKCWQEEHRKFPDSHNNIIKGLANARTGNLNRYSESGKSMIDQAVVSKVFKIEDLNIKMNNFEWFVDMENVMYKKIDIKSSCLRIIRAGLLKYYIWSFHTYRKIDINTFICIGYDRNRNNIDFVWIIPNDRELITSESINITKGDSGSKYGKFKVDAKPYNDAYHSLMEFLKNKKYFGIEDVKKWLNEEKVLKGDERMCFVDAGSSNIEIEQSDLEPVRYKCMDCESKFKAIGKRIKCPTCESARVEKI